MIPYLYADLINFFLKILGIFVKPEVLNGKTDYELISKNRNKMFLNCLQLDWDEVMKSLIQRSNNLGKTA